MPDIFEIERNGEIFEVEANSEEEALALVNGEAATPTVAPAEAMRQRRGDARLMRDLADPFLLPPSTPEGDPGPRATYGDPGTALATMVGNIPRSAANLGIGTVKMLEAMSGVDPMAGYNMVAGFLPGLAERYGGLENIRNTAIEDPVGMGAELYGGFKGAQAVGSRAANVARAAATTEGATSPGIMARVADAGIGAVQLSPTKIVKGAMGHGPLAKIGKVLDFFGSGEAPGVVAERLPPAAPGLTTSEAASVRTPGQGVARGPAPRPNVAPPPLGVARGPAARPSVAPPPLRPIASHAPAGAAEPGMTSSRAARVAPPPHGSVAQEAAPTVGPAAAEPGVSTSAAKSVRPPRARTVQQAAPPEPAEPVAPGPGIRTSEARAQRPPAQPRRQQGPLAEEAAKRERAADKAAPPAPATVPPPNYLQQDVVSINAPKAKNMGPIEFAGESYEGLRIMLEDAVKAGDFERAQAIRSWVSQRRKQTAKAGSK